MGKKINPKILRIGVIKSWPSTWYGKGNAYIRNIQQDIYTRRFLINKFKEAGINKVEIQRDSKKITISVHTAKPGLIIGRGGTGVEDLKKEIHRKFFSRPAGVRPSDLNINIVEVDRPNLSAQIIVQAMIVDLEKRIPFRRVIKQAVSRVERAGALGVKVEVNGRLNGAEIARGEKLGSGKVPLQTLRADVDYARGFAKTTYGCIGIKVWIYKGEIFEKESNGEAGQVVGKKI